MSVIRTEHMVPLIYANESRDFQLVLRMYDYILNGAKRDIDSILGTTDTKNIDDKLLQVLQSKIGFFSNKIMTGKELRAVLSAFPYIIRYKGSAKSIGYALNVFCKIKGITSGYTIEIFNQNLKEETKEKLFNKYGVDKYLVVVSINAPFEDTTILNEIFRYILPPSYAVVYNFTVSRNSEETGMNIKDEVIFKFQDNSYPIFGEETSNFKIVDGSWYTDENMEKYLNSRVNTAMTANTPTNYLYKSTNETLMVLHSDPHYYIYPNNDGSIEDRPNLNNRISNGTTQDNRSKVGTTLLNYPETTTNSQEETEE